MAAEGPYSNEGTASVIYTDADGDVAGRSDSDTSHYFGADPSIDIDKKTADELGNEVDENLAIKPGEAVTWNYYVTNTGNVPLANVSVADDQPGVSPVFDSEIFGDGDAVFEPDEIWLYTASGIAGEGFYHNVGTAQGDYSDDVGNSTTITDSDESSYYGSTPGMVTDSSLCDFGEQFRLIFTPDMKRHDDATPLYRLSDSNPGQFYYNVFYTNDDLVPPAGGDTSTVSLEIPYPFVTQGARPVHVYAGVTVEQENGTICLVPRDEIASYGSTLTLGDYTDTNMDGMVGFGDVYLVDVPAEDGFQYINIHLDYGLEKTTDWQRMGDDAVNDGLTFPSLAGIAINDNTVHAFRAYADGTLIPGSGDAVNNVNEFKQVAPIVGDANHDGIFNSTDLIEVLAEGKYETGEPATWEQGDWNGDGIFDSGDLVLALQEGNYVADSTPAAELRAVDAVFARSNDQ
jgi:hypothetical protein